MSRRFMVRAVLAAASVLAVSASNSAGADALTIDLGRIDRHGCFGQAACELDGADIATTGGILRRRSSSASEGFGVSGGASGAEIDIGQTLRVDFDESRSIVAIKILFLFNGPEYSDRAEKAQVIADGTTYTLAILNDADDAAASWSGPGTVTKCGATTLAGTGCFIVTDPFPGAISRLDFTAVAGSHAVRRRGHERFGLFDRIHRCRGAGRPRFRQLRDRGGLPGRIRGRHAGRDAQLHASRERRRSRRRDRDPGPDSGLPVHSASLRRTAAAGRRLRVQRQMPLERS